MSARQSMDAHVFPPLLLWPVPAIVVLVLKRCSPLSVRIVDQLGSKKDFLPQKLTDLVIEVLRWQYRSRTPYNAVLSASSPATSCRDEFRNALVL